LKYPPFPWAQNFQDGFHQTTGAQRKIFEKGKIFFGHPVFYEVLEKVGSRKNLAQTVGNILSTAADFELEKQFLVNVRLVRTQYQY
jgi:hypothetical protein